MCDSLPLTSCHNGSSSEYSEHIPVCPVPLVFPNSDSFLTDATIHFISGTACAYPCPAFIFTPEDWSIFKNVLFYAYGISFILSVICALSCYQDLDKNFNIFMVCIGCINASFWMTLFTYITYDGDNLTCTGNAGFIESNTFCVFCGVMLIASVNWFASWSFFISFQLWLSVKYW